MNRIFYIVKKEFIQTFNDKRMVMLIFVAPILQLVLLGYAVNMDIKHVSTAVIDRDMSFESRDFIRDLSASKYFDIVSYLGGNEDVHKIFQKQPERIFRESVEMDFLGLDAEAVNLGLQLCGAFPAHLLAPGTQYGRLRDRQPFPVMVPVGILECADVSVAAIPKIIQQMLQRGYRAATVKALFGQRN